MGMIAKLTFSVLLVFTGANAWAGISQCQKDAKKAEDDCDKAFKDANAADAARSADTQAGSGNDINQNCSKMGNDIGKQQGNVGQAQAKCSAALGKCSSSCKEADTDAKTEPAMGIERGKIAARRSQCQNKISPQVAQLAQALGNLAKNAAEAAACKQASENGKGGQPPQIPPPPPKEDKPKEEKQALNCDGEEGARYSDCNAKYLAKCMNKMNESGCELFANRYCGNATGGSSVNVNNGGGLGGGLGGMRAQSAFKTQATNLVVDKSGEGLGSGFCKMVTAYRFCQAVGRTECPSCRGQYAYSTAACQNDPTKCIPNISNEQLTDAKNKCPTDPIFLDPSVAKALENGEGVSNQTKNNEPVKTQAPTAGAGGSGSGGSGSTGGGALGGGGAGVIGANNEGIDGATPESLPGGSANAVGSGGAGGYGGEESVTEEEEENRDPASAGMSDGILPASAVEGMPARDVSNQYGPNLFSISSQVYRTLCAAEKLSTCVQRRK